MTEPNPKEIQAKLPFVDVSKEFKMEEVLTIKGKEYVVAAVIVTGGYIKITPKVRFDAQKALVAPFRRPGRPS